MALTWSLITPPLVLLLLGALACASVARGEQARREQQARIVDALRSRREPIPDREELEMNVSPAPQVEKDLLVTAHGYERLRAELETLRTVHRAALTEQFREAREDRDPDNPALFDLLEEQVQLEGRISLLEAQVAGAQVVRPTGDGAAAIGSRVRVRHCDSGDVAEYDLVGPIESDVGNGRVSVAAPVGRAVLGRMGGDTVIVATPRGPKQLEILAVKAADPRDAREAA
jgi:transcription elongation factor GreA